MTLWAARTEAILYLEKNCSSKLAVLLDLFDAIDVAIDCYENLSGTNLYARICGLTLLKAKNLGLGAYSLILDGLGQESGALLRPFIEYTELLTYFRNFPDRVSEVVNNSLPNAGKRAQAINSIYKNFRSHLNLHASHSSYSDYAISHLLEPKTLKFKKLQRTAYQVLETNLRDFTIQLYLLYREAVLSVERLELKEFEQLAERADNLKVKLFKEFDLGSLELK